VSDLVTSDEGTLQYCCILQAWRDSRLGSRDPVATHDQMWAAWWQEEQDEVVYGSFVEPPSQDRAEIIVAAKS
jgi:hypothetical protein